MAAQRSFRPTLFVLIFSLFFISTSELSAQAHAKAETAASPDVNLAVREQFEQSNIKVKELYSGTLDLLEGLKDPKAFSYKKALVTSQNSWMSYRSGHCQLIAKQADTAPTHPETFYYQCITEINQTRILELENLQATLKAEFSAIVSK